MENELMMIAQPINCSITKVEWNFKTWSSTLLEWDRGEAEEILGMPAVYPKGKIKFGR